VAAIVTEIIAAVVAVAAAVDVAADAIAMITEIVDAAEVLHETW
jgi:hypothetical protein